jgi:NAD(P)-dependent dehydrogenase (short-subunit alcohol dehydrogenase family)
MGAHIVIVSRNEARTKALAEQIHLSGGRAQAFTADLSSMIEVRRVAREIHASYDHIDVLLNNVGAFFTSHQYSVDGLEMTFALNHVSYFLLTQELMDLIQLGKNPRIVNVASAAHFGGHIDFNNLQLIRGFNGWRAYNNSKLMNLLFTYELSRRLTGSGITANVLHPGFVATNFGRSNGGIFKPIFGMIYAGALTPEEGAKTSIYLASSPDVEGVSGKYFVNSKSAKSSEESYNRTVAARLWDVTADLISQ